jgi:hypothetical protein
MMRWGKSNLKLSVETYLTKVETAKVSHPPSFWRHRGRNLTLDISNFIDDRLIDNAGMKKG